MLHIVKVYYTSSAGLPVPAGKMTDKLSRFMELLHLTITLPIWPLPMAD